MYRKIPIYLSSHFSQLYLELRKVRGLALKRREWKFVAYFGVVREKKEDGE